MMRKRSPFTGRALPGRAYQNLRRVFVLINNTGIGGTERRFGRLFARIADEHPEVVLIVNAGLWKQLVAAEVCGREQRVVKLPEPCRTVAAWLGLRHGPPAFWIRKLDYLLFAGILLVRYMLAARRLFHLVLGGTYVALPLMLLRRDHRTVVSVVSTNLAMLPGVPSALPLYRLALGLCHVIDVLSESTRGDLIERGVPGGKICVSPGSVVDLKRFRPASDKEPWVVFAGRLIEEKNPLLFMEAVPAVLRAVPTAKFFLLGDGPLRPLVEQAVDRSQVGDLVHRGFYADPAPVLAKARVFVSLQRQDNYPSQSLLEAMACGAVPVATDVGMTWRLVDETTGARVKPDPMQVANAVIQLLNDPARCTGLGESARRRVAEEHSEARYDAYLGELYARAER